MSARLWACSNQKGGTRRGRQSERESSACHCVCQPERACASAARSRARRACMLALMRSRQADSLTPKISTTGMKTGTNTLTDTSSPAIPPIVRATRRQTESAASAELRTTCEHSWHSSPAGDAVRSRIRSIFRRSSEKVTLTSVGRSRLRQKGGWRHTFRVMTRSRASFADAILSCAPTRPRPGPPARGLPRPRTTFALGSATDRGSIPFPCQLSSNSQYWLWRVQFPYNGVSSVEIVTRLERYSWQARKMQKIQAEFPDFVILCEIIYFKLSNLDCFFLMQCSVKSTSTNSFPIRLFPIHASIYTK